MLTEPMYTFMGIKHKECMKECYQQNGFEDKHQRSCNYRKIYRHILYSCRRLMNKSHIINYKLSK